ncbi:DNA-directed RNA polymerase subunit omega [Pirellulimonas nuda]|uniref:DNA-directed RNA polymerase subunit omega n=2 Tax=Pirellulimonas nuda TaxID=2528009 RepID=A0A518DGR6_9BACT|nr:DNA-directed RNA polymerase subunit omega [Pirellulimonas nuda]
MGAREGERMIDALKEEEIVNKVGGRFKLSTLIQKRLVALNAGARPLVDLETKEKMEIVVEEILRNKIYLDSSNELKITGSSPSVGGPIDFDLDSL